MRATSDRFDMVRIRTRELSPALSAPLPSVPQSPAAFDLSKRASTASSTEDDAPFVISGLNSAGYSQYRRKRAVRPLSDRRIDLSGLKSRIVIEVIHVD